MYPKSWKQIIALPKWGKAAWENIIQAFVIWGVNETYKCFSVCSAQLLGSYSLRTKRSALYPDTNLSHYPVLSSIAQVRWLLCKSSLKQLPRSPISSHRQNWLHSHPMLPTQHHRDVSRNKRDWRFLETFSYSWRVWRKGWYWNKGEGRVWELSWLVQGILKGFLFQFIVILLKIPWGHGHELSFPAFAHLPAVSNVAFSACLDGSGAWFSFFCFF